jgi:hypothetical protein
MLRRSCSFIERGSRAPSSFRRRLEGVCRRANADRRGEGSLDEGGEGDGGSGNGDVVVLFSEDIFEGQEGS